MPLTPETKAACDAARAREIAKFDEQQGRVTHTLQRAGYAIGNAFPERIELALGFFNDALHQLTIARQEIITLRRLGKSIYNRRTQEQNGVYKP